MGSTSSGPTRDINCSSCVVYRDRPLVQHISVSKTSWVSKALRVLLGLERGTYLDPNMMAFLAPFLEALGHYVIYCWGPGTGRLRHHWNEASHFPGLGTRPCRLCSVGRSLPCSTLPCACVCSRQFPCLTQERVEICHRDILDIKNLRLALRMGF